MPKVEYRVRPVTRFIVTRYDGSGSRQIGGEHDNEEQAFAIAYALCAKEHKDAGTPEDDPDFQYPVRVPSPVLTHIQDVPAYAVLQGRLDIKAEIEAKMEKELRAAGADEVSFRTERDGHNYRIVGTGLQRPLSGHAMQVEADLMPRPRSPLDDSEV